MSTVMSYVGILGIIAILYGIRAILYLWMPNPRHIAVLMAFGFVLAVPGIWFFSPDWKNPQLLTIGKWIGTPVAVMTVAIVSFCIDQFRGLHSLSRWFIRFPLEIFIGVPVWAFIWARICLYILGWVWV